MSDARSAVTHRIVLATLTLAFALVPSLVLGGCANSAPARPDAPDYAVDDIREDPFYKSGLRLVWRAYPQVGTRERPLFLEPVGDALTFQDTGNTLSLIEDTTGRIRWTASLGRPLEKFVGTTRRGGSIIAASESELQFLDIQNGQLVDRQRLAVLANTKPVLVSGVAVMGSTTGEVFGHDLSVGVRRWGVALDGPIITPVVPVGGRDVALVSAGGEVIILNALEGVSSGRRTTLFDGVSTSVVADNGQIYIAGLDQSVWAYNIETGRRVWRHRTESRLDQQPLVSDGVVVVYAEREGLLGLDARSGDVLWTQSDAPGHAVAARGSAVYIWNGTTLRVVSLRDGSVRSQVELPGIVQFVDGENGILYVVDVAGVVSKFEPL